MYKLIERVSVQIYNDIMMHSDITDWADIPVWRETTKSHRDMTRASIIRLLNTDNVTPEKSHALWFMDAYRRGWRYGETFDPHAKPFPTNPRMIPFACMPKEAQEISDIVVSVFRHNQARLIESLGLYGRDEYKQDNRGVIIPNASILNQNNFLG